MPAWDLPRVDRQLSIRRLGACRQIGKHGGSQIKFRHQFWQCLGTELSAGEFRTESRRCAQVRAVVSGYVVVKRRETRLKLQCKSGIGSKPLPSLLDDALN